MVYFCLMVKNIVIQKFYNMVVVKILDLFGLHSFESLAIAMLNKEGNQLVAVLPEFEDGLSKLGKILDF